MRYLAIHHSAVAVDSSAESIARYHVESQGWPGIGYHWLVHQDGRVEYVGDETTIRYNVASRNREVVGICLPGNFNERPPGAPQLDALRRLVAWRRSEHPTWQVKGHGELAVAGWETECPGATWPEWRGALG